MDPRLLDVYDRELQHLRKTGAEFAKEFPKIASRLGMEGIEVADPYVERLLEGFAFLAARVQLKIDAQFPAFTQHLLEMVYPHYLAPTPSMAIVQLRPSPDEGALIDGVVVPRGTVLKTPHDKDQETACEYRTAHDVRLLPIEIVEAEYTGYSRDWAAALERVVDRRSERVLRQIRAGLRLRLRTTGGLTFDKVALDAVSLQLRGVGEVPARMYEQIHGNAVGVFVRPGKAKDAWFELLPKTAIRRIGFADDEALLPYGPRSFQGYRLLHEYFAFPERFLFAEIGGLRPSASRCKESEIEVVVLFDRSEPTLENAVDPTNFGLFCTPAINLFPLRCDNIHLTRREPDYHVVPDRTRPLDFEIYDLTSVVGRGSGAESDQEFRPFYTIKEREGDEARRAYYTLRRDPRLLSQRQRRSGVRTAYAGSEVFVALVDPAEAPYRADLRELTVAALCTNRDLPLEITLGRGRTDFQLKVSAPVESVRCVAGPTVPRPSHVRGETAWRLISHLAPNYLSLVDDDARSGAHALRELLSLYVPANDAPMSKQIEGLRSIAAAPIVRRMRTPGPITFGRGLEIAATFDESAFRGSGAFVLGAVLEDFFARYVSLNAFTETVIRTVERGEIMRWPARAGRSHTL